MSRFEWVIVLAMLLIAFAVTLTNLDGTLLGKWLSGEPLPEMKSFGNDRLFYAIALVSLLIWWGSRLFPNQRDFLRTGAFVLLGVGVLYALYLLAR